MNEINKRFIVRAFPLSMAGVKEQPQQNQESTLALRYWSRTRASSAHINHHVSLCDVDWAV